MCVSRVNSRVRKGEFFAQKGLNLMAGQIDTKILFIVSFIKSLFMRHVHTHTHKRIYINTTHTNATPLGSYAFFVGHRGNRAFCVWRGFLIHWVYNFRFEFKWRLTMYILSISLFIQSLFIAFVLHLLHCDCKYYIRHRGSISSWSSSKTHHNFFFSWQFV